jgi:hypothetical protein
MGSPGFFPLFLSIPSVNNANFTAAQLAYLETNLGLAWQVTNYLLDPQPTIPQPNGLDPIPAPTYAEKVEIVKAFTDLLAANPSMAQSYANADYIPLHTDDFWDWLYSYWNGSIPQNYYNQYEVLSDAEKSVIKRNPYDAYKVLEAKKKAWAKAEALCPNLWGRNNNKDAFTHAYWNALCAKEIGYGEAKKFTDAHESPYLTGPHAMESQMDLANNTYGLGLGQLHFRESDEFIADLIIGKIQNGEFTRISNVNYNLPPLQFEATGGLTPSSALEPTSGGVCN